MIRRLTLCSPLPCPRIQWLRPAALGFLGSGCIARLPYLPRRPYLFGKKLYPLAPMPARRFWLFGQKLYPRSPMPAPRPYLFGEKLYLRITTALRLRRILRGCFLFLHVLFAPRRHLQRTGSNIVHNGEWRCAAVRPHKKYAAAPVIGRRSAFACIMRLQFSVFRRAA